MSIDSTKLLPCVRRTTWTVFADSFTQLTVAGNKRRMEAPADLLDSGYVNESSVLYPGFSQL